LYIEKVHDLYSSLNIQYYDNQIKEAKMTGHLSPMEKLKNAHKFRLEHLRGRDRLQNLGRDGRTLLLKKFRGNSVARICPDQLWTSDSFF
jgi:hypothetical protein